MRGNAPRRRRSFFYALRVGVGTRAGASSTGAAVPGDLRTDAGQGRALAQIIRTLIAAQRDKRGLVDVRQLRAIVDAWCPGLWSLLESEAR